MSKIKFGVIGLGRIGLVHALHFSQEKEKYELVAGCDKDTQRVDNLVKEYQCAGYSSFEDFLKNPDMELVIIATNSLAHVKNAAQALADGKIVLLEKPIAVTHDDFQKLQELDKKYSGRLFFLHNHRFEPSFQTIQKIIADGILGNIQMVKIRRHHPFKRRGDWQTILSCGGGQLSCWGPHIIDQALQFIHSPVTNIWSDLKRVNVLGDADDHVKIMMKGDNGIVADIEISDIAALPDAYCTVYGNRGTLICADEKNIQLKYIDPEYTFREITASAGQPPLIGGYGSEEKFPWIEKIVKVEPGVNMWEEVELEIARHLYRTLREHVQFPVTSEQAFDVVRITELVKKQNPQFNWL